MHKKVNGFLLFFALSFYFISSFSSAQPNVNREIKNLRAFAKLYGYIRFFHPSDESANLDWDKFAVAGVEDILRCKNDEELKETLKSWYLPIAPLVNIFNDEKENHTSSAKNIRDTTRLNVVAWQHYGVWLNQNSYTYRSYRVLRGAKLSGNDRIQGINTIDKKPQSEKLFKKYPKTGEVFFSALSDKLYCIIPLTLYSDSIGTKGKNTEYVLEPLLEKLSAVDLNELNADDVRIRLSDIIIAWNVYEHFYPYFDVVKVNWDKVLTEALTQAMNDKTEKDFYFTLRKMVAKLQDGHGYVSNSRFALNYLPLKTALIENKIIVTASTDEKIKAGEELISVNGKGADQELTEKLELISGSPQYKTASALLEIGSSFSKDAAELVLKDGNEEKRVTVNRRAERWMLEFAHEPIKKISEGIYYINVNYADKEQFTEMLPELKSAKGVIFDLRFDARPRNGKGRISMWNDILWRMTEYNLQSAKWCIPEIIYPNRENISFSEKSWTMQPYPAYFNSPKVFITDAFDISHMETFMGIVEHYKLGDIVGASTAGANGNANFFSLPGGFETGFTGMKVLKHDGSQHHLIGIKPNYPVTRTIKAVKEGSDEYLEKAIEVLKSKIK